VFKVTTSDRFNVFLFFCVCSHRTTSLGQLEGDRLVQDKALVIPFEESEACLSTMQTKVKEALALGPESSIVLTDSQGNVLIDTPGIKGLCCGL